MSIDFQQVCDDLQTALFDLVASGQEGFEGLIRDAYREATGISLRLQKSGTQHGADAVSSDPSSDIAAGIEAKRYQQTTSLPLDELKSKLVDAATRKINPLELWILVASKEVSGDDVAELLRIGDEHGLGVLVLDWRAVGDPTAPLPLLLALAPNAVRQHLGDAIGNAMPVLVEHPEYVVQKERFLELLMRPDLGLSHAAKAVRDRVEHTLQSRADAKSRLQNPVDMGAASRIWAPRDGHCKAIQEWRADAASTPVCAAVGEEGAGKTWLMFDWWRRETKDDNPPLIVWLSARDVISGSIAEVIGAALEKWISVPKQNAAFWSRRAELWRRTHCNAGDAPFIWLMLDGVNEGTSQENVLKVLNDAVASEWKGNVGVLLSDRPGHWAQRFCSGKFLEVLPRVISVGKFSDAELDDLLAKHDKARSDFSTEVLKIICWPRWFTVAAELFDKELDWSTHSPEQLMLRYWQHCLQERGQIAALDDAMFRDFVAQLGAKMKAELDTEKTISKAELKKLLSGYSGAPDKDIFAAMDDVTSGIWMRQAGTHKFNVNKAVLPFAVSLALLNELRSSGTCEEADSECEKFLGPIEDQDVGADILGAAVSLAFIESEFPEHAKKTLMKRWVSGHNFGDRHFQLLWRIASASPEAFFSVAEELWLQKASGHSIDEILTKCIANIATDGGRLPDVIKFLEKWASTYWLDSHEGQFLGYNPTEGESAAAKAATEERLEQLRADLGEDALAQTKLRCCENGAGARWLIRRMFAIATYLPRAAQKPLWRGWVLSRAVMKNPRHYDDLAWSLRLNPVDGPEAADALMDTVDELLALRSEVIRPYILSLLNAHGGLEAAEKLSEIGETCQTNKYFKRDGELEPIDGIIELSDEENKGDTHAAILLSSFAKNPEVEIAAGHAEQLERYARDFPVNELSRGSGRTAAGNDLGDAEPALARWAPNALADLHRRFLTTFSKLEDSSLLGFTRSLDGLLAILPDDNQQELSAALIDRVSASPEGELDQISRSLWSAAVFDRDSATQCQIWGEIGAPKGVPLDLEPLIRAVPIDVLRKLESELQPDRERGRLVSWLGYLLLSRTKEWPENWEVLSRLFNHEDDTVRSLAIQVAVVSDDRKLARRLYETEWMASPDHNVLEDYYGSCLLSQAATPETFEATKNRIDPQWSGILWKHFEYDPTYKKPFEDFLISSIEHECNPPKQRTFPEYRCSPVEETQKLLEQDSVGITALANRLFDVEFVSPFGSRDWPRLEILRSFFELNPQQAVKYWQKTEGSKEPVRFKGDAFDELSFLAEDGDTVNEMRNMFVRSAENDWELITLGAAIGRHQRSDWAVNWIKQTLIQPESPGDIARAVTLAGLLDDSIKVKGLWSNELSGAPFGGWIDMVYSNAKQRIEAAWHALHWLDKSVEAGTDEEFFAFWRLFALSVDYRLIPIAARRLRQRPESMNPRHRDFIDFNWKTVVDRTKRDKNKLERTLFSIGTGFHCAVPWAN